METIMRLWPKNQSWFDIIINHYPQARQIILPYAVMTQSIEVVDWVLDNHLSKINVDTFLLLGVDLKSIQHFYIPLRILFSFYLIFDFCLVIGHPSAQHFTMQL